MSQALSHFLHPTAVGDTYLRKREVQLSKMGALALGVLTAAASYQKGLSPVKNSVLSGAVTVISFYAITAYFKYRINSYHLPPKPQQPDWLAPVAHESKETKTERAYFASLWRSMNGSYLDQFQHWFFYGKKDAELKAGTLEFSDNEWYQFARDAQRQMQAK